MLLKTLISFVWAIAALSSLASPLPRSRLFDDVTCHEILGDIQRGRHGDAYRHEAIQERGYTKPAEIREYVLRKSRSNLLRFDASVAESEYTYARYIFQLIKERGLFREIKVRNRGEALVQFWKEMPGVPEPFASARYNAPLLAEILARKPPLNLQSSARIEKILMLRYGMAADRFFAAEVFSDLPLHSTENSNRTLHIEELPGHMVQSAYTFQTQEKVVETFSAARVGRELVDYLPGTFTPHPDIQIMAEHLLKSSGIPKGLKAEIELELDFLRVYKLNVHPPFFRAFLAEIAAYFD